MPESSMMKRIERRRHDAFGSRVHSEEGVATSSMPIGPEELMYPIYYSLGNANKELNDALPF
jgi:hypothetical protein